VILIFCGYLLTLNLYQLYILHSTLDGSDRFSVTLWAWFFVQQAVELLAAPAIKRRMQQVEA
jgi:hypothetical protein